MPKYFHGPALAILFMAGLASSAGHAAEGGEPHVSEATMLPTCQPPRWPAVSVRLREAGTVHLRFLIGEDGKVVESLVAKSSGSERLDEAARTALSSCTFKPAVANGFPVATWQGTQFRWWHNDGPTQQGMAKAAKLRARALGGDVDAVYTLSQMFADGDEVKQNNATAEQLLRVAASHGHAKAAYDLARFPSSGQLETRNPDEVRAWYDKAADLGNADAQYHVGRDYLRGTGGRNADLAKAVVLLRKSAEQDNHSAQAELARLYAAGRGVPKDQAEALAWSRKAVQGDMPDAYAGLGSVLAGSGAGTDAGEAVTLLTRAAQLRHPDAEMQLAMLYLNGTGVVRNPAEALKLLRRAVNGGHLPAMAALGEMLVRGSDVPADPAQGWALLRKAAERGSAAAQKRLELMPAEYAKP